MADAKTPEFTTVYHPDLAGVSNEVPTETVEAWQAQGWLKSAPKDPASSI